MAEFLVREEKECRCCGNKYKTLSSEGYYCTKCGQAMTITLCPNCRKTENYHCPNCGASKSSIAKDDRGCFVTKHTYKGVGLPMEVTLDDGNVSLNNDFIKRLTQTFGDGKDKYYVYMLIVEGEGKPFYIGKGAGARVFAHEFDAMNAEEMLKAINEERDDVEANYNKLSEKIKTIINNKGKIKKVIVKWGLTSEEAFMCESALINMYDYLCKNASQTVLSESDVLSNIVNGHASKKEKDSKSIDELKTKSRDLEDFLENVAIQETSFPRNIKKRCVFININTAMDWWYKKYNDGTIDRNEYIKDSVRFSWTLRDFGNKNASEKAYKGPDYVIALYRQVVVGVYKVNRWFRFTEINENQFPKYSPYHRMNDRCVFKSYKDKNEPNYELYKELFENAFKEKYNLDYSEYCKKREEKENLPCIDTTDIYIKENNSGEDKNSKDKKYNDILKRIGFELEESKDEQMNSLKGCLLSDPFLRLQNSYYNFDRDGKINYTKWDNAAKGKETK